jgi:lipoprotein-anchoring transpeptidase ErfK/SrfK
VTGARLAALLAACALAGALVATVLAGAAAAAGSGEPEPPPTETQPVTIPEGVHIGGIEVGGLTPEVALSVVRTGFSAPLVVTVAGSTLKPTPERLGAVAYVQNALNRARTAEPGTDVPLFVRLDGQRIRAYVATVANRFDRRPRDSTVLLRNRRPFVTQHRPGRALDRAAATQAVARALSRNERLPLALAFRPLPARVTRANVGPVVVIHRGSNRLRLYRGMQLQRTFVVATGKSRYPTPLGRFQIVTKWANPWWHPPASDWARGMDPIPPGPGNPLGTRWMGISSPGVGIHGTPDPGSLGYSVSHGCIRMAIRDAEWLFPRVRIGTPVFIIGA